MRSLILLLMLAFLRVSSAQAAAPSFKLSTKVLAERGSTGAANTGLADSSTVTTSTDLGTGSVLAPFTFRMGYDRKQSDNERILLTDRSGNVRSLAQFGFGAENTVRGGADFSAGSLMLSLDGSHTVGLHPYPGYGAGVKAVLDSYASGSRFSGEISRSDYSSPESYFVHPDSFRTLQRPQRLLEDSAKLAWEQVLAERWRSRLLLDIAERPNRRPMKFGLEGTLAWAFHDDKALFTSLGAAKERRSDTLYDDRGYLSAYWLQTELRYEPVYSWRISGRLGTMLETETPRGSLRRQRVGTDSLGIELRKITTKLEFGLEALGAFANSGYRNLQIGGNFTWLL